MKQVRKSFGSGKQRLEYASEYRRLYGRSKSAATGVYPLGRTFHLANQAPIIHPVYGFSILLPEDWVVEESTTSDPLMSGHSLSLHPNYVDKQNIHMAFRRAGEDVGLWPTGVGQGEFNEQGTLDITGQSARAFLLVCPNGDVTAIWHHGSDEAQPNIARGDMEFGFIYSAGGHCESGLSLGGKVQRWGEMIVASLKVH